MRSKTIVLLGFLLFTFFISPGKAEAFSFSDFLNSSSSFMTKVKEGIEYTFAFTVSKKVQVLEKQATKRLEEAKNEAQKGENKKVENSVKTYEKIKDQQSLLIDQVDKVVVEEVKTQTINQQKTLKEIVVFAPNNNQVIEEVHNTVVENVKNVIEYKEGTTAGTAFEDKATHTYAPGTGPGEGGIKYEGGEGQQWAPGTSGSGGTSGHTYEGGQQVILGQ